MAFPPKSPAPAVPPKKKSKKSKPPMPASRGVGGMAVTGPLVRPC